jgi:hypothetical protein
MEQITFLAKVEVEAVVALVPNSNYWQSLAAMALYVFPYLLSRFNDQLNMMGLMVVPSDS